MNKVLVAGSLVATMLPLAAEAFESGMSELYRFKGKGDFVVGGVSARQFDSATPQSNPFFVHLPAAPAGATLVKAFANWSYMTNFLGDAGEKTVNIAGTNVGPAGVSMSYADLDCNWGTSYGVSFTSDITAIVAANGFDFDYTITDGVDDPNSGGMAEGLTILAIFRDANAVDRDISVYKGYTSTRSGNAEGTMTFDEYEGGDVHFFLNGLDGQKDFGPAPMTDNFYLNGFEASADIGGESGNAWQGKRRFNFLPNTTANHMYDHAELNVSTFMDVGDSSLHWDTDGFDDFGTYTDAIAHSFGAIAVPVPEPATWLVLVGAGSLILRRRRLASKKEEAAK